MRLFFLPITSPPLPGSHFGINKVASLLNEEGKFLLSIDKNQENFIDTGKSKIVVFPDNAENISHCINTSGLELIRKYETEFAVIFSAEKQ